MKILHLDFETRSAIDLFEVGLRNYAQHPSTDIWCAAYAFDNDEPKVIGRDGILPAEIILHIDKGGIVSAHNAAFELAIWNEIMVPRYGWPELRLEQVRCTMAQCYAMSLPGDLERAGGALGLPVTKDMVGHRLMKQMCRPRAIQDGKPIWWDETDKIRRLGEYCKQDVRSEQAIHDRVFALSAYESKIWIIDRKINDRGVYVDIPAIRCAIPIVRLETERLNQKMQQITNDAVSSCTEVVRLARWCGSRGFPMDSVDKEHIADALLEKSVPSDVREALLTRQEAGKSSVAKLTAMIESASPTDGRVRDTLQFHAASTGRWGGRRIQPQNLPRPSLEQEDIEQAIDIILKTKDPREAAKKLDVLYGSPMEVISSCIRGMIRSAPGNILTAFDFSNIEGRGLAWLAGEQWKLDAFSAQDAKTGPEIYKLAYARAFGIDVNQVTGNQRQGGKVMELALGYGGGVGAFQSMAAAYRFFVEDAKADEFKLGWRRSHPNIVTYWSDLENAALYAVNHPNTVTYAGPKGREVKFRTSGSFLWCKLPSGRVLCYPYPNIKDKLTPWGEYKPAVHYKTVDGTTNQWAETHTYGGKLSENVTQAICRDILADAIKRCDESAIPVILHVHDEIVAETPESLDISAEMEKICSTAPSWGVGWPMHAKGWRETRYRK